MTTPDPLATRGLPQRRTVLLAQPGAARDRLREALQQAGAEVVLVADPSSTDVEAVLAAEPDSILVALDPAIEAQLDRFDAVLGDPAITVIFDEAELAARREGWDAARWSRHLQAKLYGHDDVLPPGKTESDDDFPQPGLPTTPQQHHAQASFVEYAGEAESHAEVLPTDVVGAGMAEVDAVDAELLDVDSTPFDSANLDSGDFGGIDFNSFDMGGETRETRDNADGNVVGLDEYLLNTEEASSEAAEIPSAAKPRTFNASDWSLDDAETATARPAAITGNLNIEELERRIAGLSLADTDSYGHGPQRGAVVLLAGLGGPDAVRQMLKNLPEGFPRPVLIVQRLDAGQHDKLVGQMARASAMPVQLALIDTVLEAGNVYVVPPALGLTRKANELRFSSSGNLFDALPANDSAIVMLSGGDTASVDPIMRLASSGAWVAGQSAEGCFEPAAANDLVARGGEVGLPAQLAERLSERWPV